MPWRPGCDSNNALTPHKVDSILQCNYLPNQNIKQNMAVSQSSPTSSPTNTAAMKRLHHRRAIRHTPVVDALTDISHWSTQTMRRLPSTQRRLEQYSSLNSAGDCENKQLCQSLLSYRTLRNRQRQWRRKKTQVGRESSGRNAKTVKERENFVSLAPPTRLQSKHQPTHALNTIQSMTSTYMETESNKTPANTCTKHNTVHDKYLHRNRV